MAVLPIYGAGRSQALVAHRLASLHETIDLSASVEGTCRILAQADVGRWAEHVRSAQANQTWDEIETDRQM
jgi:hypothetical protein